MEKMNALATQWLPSPDSLPVVEVVHALIVEPEEDVVVPQAVVDVVGAADVVLHLTGPQLGQLLQWALLDQLVQLAKLLGHQEVDEPLVAVAALDVADFQNILM